MIELINLSKSYTVHGVQKTVADRINITFPTGMAVALLGRNGAGKSSLLRMISGTTRPDGGQITSDGSVSWPVGFAGSFHPDLTGAQNTRFVARIYGVNVDQLCAFVAGFADLGGHFHLPFRTYSSGMRSRLAFGISMGIGFETYLIDEVTSVGDANFRTKSEAILRDRLRNSGAIVVSHSLGLLRNLCQAGVVLENGTLVWHDGIENAIRHHQDIMTAG